MTRRNGKLFSQLAKQFFFGNTSLNSATCFCENIEKTLEPARLARLDEEPPDLDDWRVEPDGVVGVAAAGVAAGVSSGVASTVDPSSFFFFLTFFSFSDCYQIRKNDNDYLDDMCEGGFFCSKKMKIVYCQ